MAQLYFLACFFLTSYLVSGQLPQYGLHGQAIDLIPVIAGQPDEILWKHNGNKVVEFNGKEQHVYGRYENRVTLDWVSAELNIRDLSQEDSGEYVLELFKNKDLTELHYTVEVIGKVAKPTISCRLNDTDGTQATLTCSAEPTHPESSMQFEWESGGNMLPGPSLPISLEDKHRDTIYTCRVSNPLTHETETFTAKNCYYDKSSNEALVASLAVISCVLLLLVLVVVIVFCKQKRKACFAETKSNGSINQASPGQTEESNEGRSPRDNEALLNRAPTLPSNQRLHQSERNMKANHHKDPTLDMDMGKESKEGKSARSASKPEVPEGSETKPLIADRGTDSKQNADKEKKTVCSPPSLGRKPSLGNDEDSVPCDDKEDADADESRATTHPSTQQIPESNRNIEANPHKDTTLEMDKDKESKEGKSARSASKPEVPEGSETKPLIADRGTDSKQNADKEKKTVCSPPSLGRKPSLGNDEDSVPCDDKEDADADESRATTHPSTQQIPESNRNIEANPHKDTTLEMDKDKDSKQNADKEKKTVCSPPSLGRKPSLGNDEDNVPCDDKEDADESRGPAEEKVPECDSSHSEKANEPVPADALDCSDCTEPEPEKKADENKEAKSSPANGKSPPLNKNSPDIGIKDTVEGHEEDVNSGQVNE